MFVYHLCEWVICGVITIPMEKSLFRAKSKVSIVRYGESNGFPDNLDSRLLQYTNVNIFIPGG